MYLFAQDVPDFSTGLASCKPPNFRQTGTIGWSPLVIVKWVDWGREQGPIY